MPIDPVTTIRIETYVARLVMIGMAAAIAYTGYSVITRPLAIPLAIVLWLGATAIFFLGIWGTLPQTPERHPHVQR